MSLEEKDYKVLDLSYDVYNLVYEWSEKAKTAPSIGNGHHFQERLEPGSSPKNLAFDDFLTTLER